MSIYVVAVQRRTRWKFFGVPTKDLGRAKRRLLEAAEKENAVLLEFPNETQGERPILLDAKGPFSWLDTLCRSVDWGTIVSEES